MTGEEQKAIAECMGCQNALGGRGSALLAEHTCGERVAALVAPARKKLVPVGKPAAVDRVREVLLKFRIDRERTHLRVEEGVLHLDGDAPKGLRSALARIGWLVKVDKRLPQEIAAEDDPINYLCRELDREAGARAAPVALAEQRGELTRAARGWGPGPAPAMRVFVGGMGGRNGR